MSSDPNSWAAVLKEAKEAPGFWSLCAIGLAVISAIVFFWERNDPTAFEGHTGTRGYAIIFFLIGLGGFVGFGLRWWMTRPPKLPREADPIPEFRVPRLAKPTQLEREMEEVARLRSASTERPLLDPIVRPQIITSSDDLSAPSPGTPSAQFEAAATAAEEQGKVKKRPKLTQYNNKLPQNHAAQREAEALTPPDASIWAKQLGETRVVMPEETAFPIPQTGTVQIVNPWLREVYLNGDFAVRAGIASGENITVPAGDVLLETRNWEGRVDFRKRLHVAAGRIYTKLHLEPVPPEPGSTPLTLGERIDGLRPRSRDYLRYFKAKALLQIEARSTDSSIRELVDRGFLLQTKQTPSGIGTYLTSTLATEAYPLLNPDIVDPDPVPPWDRP